jgi:hypothetical protein
VLRNEFRTTARILARFYCGSCDKTRAFVGVFRANARADRHLAAICCGFCRDRGVFAPDRSGFPVFVATLHLIAEVLLVIMASLPVIVAILLLFAATLHMFAKGLRQIVAFLRAIVAGWQRSAESLHVILGVNSTLLGTQIIRTAPALSLVIVMSVAPNLCLKISGR